MVILFNKWVKLYDFYYTSNQITTLVPSHTNLGTKIYRYITPLDALRHNLRYTLNYVHI